MVGEGADGARVASVRSLRPHLSLPAGREQRSASLPLWFAGAGALILTALSVYGYTENPPEGPLVSVYRYGDSVPEIIRQIVVAWVFIASGLVAWHRRPGNRIGPLIFAVGAVLLLAGFQYLPVPALVTLGVWLSTGAGLSGVLLGVLVLAYPSGRIAGRLDRAWVWLAGLYLLGLLGVALITPRPLAATCICPPLITLTYNDPLRSNALNVIDLVFAALTFMLIGLVARRWLRSTGPARRALMPVWLAGAVIVLLAATGATFWNLWAQQGGYFKLSVPSLGRLIWGTGVNPDVWVYLPWVQSLSLLLVPLALLFGLLRMQFGQSAVSRLARELQRSPRRPLVGALRHALRDPSLDLAFWSRPAAGYVNLEGEPVSMPGDENVRALTRLDGEDGPLAALIHDPALAEQRPLVDGVAAVARLSIENERLHAEVRAQLEEVRASRERIVRAADYERRRVERNIHDGAQQRLVSLALALSMAQSKVTDSSPEVAATLVDAEAELKTAIRELRELARGIHPAILTEAGLGPALESLVEHSPVPVRLHTELSGRLAASVEAAAYFVVAEALTNVAKYAAATSVELSAIVVDGWLRLVVADDGVGGADPEQGSGLRGLLDRVAALGGRLSVEDLPGGGTRLTAEMPCG